ncbi:unnamed protein product, partial [Closterium sp. NIES-53]
MDLDAVDYGEDWRDEDISKDRNAWSADDADARVLHSPPGVHGDQPTASLNQRTALAAPPSAMDCRNYDASAYSECVLRERKLGGSVIYAALLVPGEHISMPDGELGDETWPSTSAAPRLVACASSSGRVSVHSLASLVASQVLNFPDWRRETSFLSKGERKIFLLSFCLQTFPLRRLLIPNSSSSPLPASLIPAHGQRARAPGEVGGGPWGEAGEGARRVGEAQPAAAVQAHKGAAFGLKSCAMGTQPLLFSCGDDGRIAGWCWSDLLSSSPAH